MADDTPLIHEDASAVGGLYQRRPSPLARCIAAAGNKRPAGELLYQLIYRFRQGDALLERKDGQWVAQAARCWLDELCMSKNQFDAALKALKGLGLVEVVQRRIGPYSPMRITHIRLTGKGASVGRDPKPGQPAGPISGNSNGPDQGVPTALKQGSHLVGREGAKGIEERNRNQGKKTGQRDGTQPEGGSENREIRGELSYVREEDRREFLLGLAEIEAALPPWMKGDDVADLVEKILDETGDRAPAPRGEMLKAYRAMYDDFARLLYRRWRHHGELEATAGMLLCQSIVRWSAFWSYSAPWERGDHGWPTDFTPLFLRHKTTELFAFILDEADFEPEALEVSGP